MTPRRATAGAGIPFPIVPFRALPFKIVRDDRLDDHAVFLIAPMWRGDPWIYTGSTRGFGAVAAYNLAAAYRPDGVP